jgi:hypothetical protein
MVYREPQLVTLVKLVDEIPELPNREKPKRGRPQTYSNRLIVKALFIMIVRRLYSAYSLLAFLEEEGDLTRLLRENLSEAGRFPSRRTWERRLEQLPQTLPSLIGVLGRYLLELIQPYAQEGRAVALDSTALRANGGVWHHKDREKGIVPHSSIDTEAGWSKSGYHGWWYGWKLHLACTIGSLWIPLAAAVTVANTHDSIKAIELAQELSADIRYCLGDKHYRDDDFRAYCRLTGRSLITSRSGRYPHSDAGVEVRKIFHKLRSQAIEPFNNLFKNVFEWRGQVPVKGLRPTQAFVLGAVLLYQVVLLYQFCMGKALGKHTKSLLRAA